MWKDFPKPTNKQELEGQIFIICADDPPRQNSKNPNLYSLTAKLVVEKDGKTGYKTIEIAPLISADIRDLMNLAEKGATRFSTHEGTDGFWKIVSVAE